MKVHVLSVGSAETSSLLSGLAAAGLPVDSRTLPHCQFDLAAPPPAGIYLNWIAPHAIGAAPKPTVDLARQVLAWLAAKPVSPAEPPRVLVNGAAALELSLAHLRQRTLLREAGIHVPRTMVVVGGTRELEGAARSMPAPFVVRANRAGSDAAPGAAAPPGAALFGDFAAFSGYVRGPHFLRSADGVTLLQEYVPPDGGALIRIRIAAGEFLYASRVPIALDAARAGGLKRLAAAPASRETLLPDFDSPIIDRFIVFAARQGLDIASLDLARDAAGRYVALGLSTTPEFPAHLEHAARTPGLPTLAAALRPVLVQMLPPQTVRTPQSTLVAA